MKTLLMLAFCFFAYTACAATSKVWVIKETPTGGVLGYVRGSESDDEYREKMWAVMKCPTTYDLVSDEMKQEQYTYSTVRQVDNSAEGVIKSGRRKANYTERSTSSVPVTNTGYRTWREFTYKCPN